jgi:hypothetical protein
MVPVAAFGFLQANASITVQGNRFSSASLLPSSRTDFSLVGGDIKIVGREITTSGGHANLMSLASAGEVILGNHFVIQEAGTTLGNISLSQFSLVDTTAESAGDITIRGHLVELNDNSHLLARSLGEASGNVDIAANTLEIKGLSEIHTENCGQIPGGNIVLSVDSLHLDAGTILTQSDSTNNVGNNIIVQGQGGLGTRAHDVRLDNGSGILSTFFGGESVSIPALISIAAEIVEFLNNSGIGNNGSASGGIVDISATEWIVMANSNVSTGSPGSIISDTPLLRLDNSGIEVISQFGTPGVVDIHAGELTMSNGSFIAGRSTGARGSQLNIAADHIALDQSSIDTSTFFEDDAGSIRITGNLLDLRNGSSIQSSTFSSGNAGSLVINVDRLRSNVDEGGSPTLQNRNLISTSSEDFSHSGGAAGTITIQGKDGVGPASSITMADTSVTTVATGGSGTLEPASIKMSARDISFVATYPGVSVQISADTQGSAPAETFR